jgi:hypothetical protein
MGACGHGTAFNVSDFFFDKFFHLVSVHPEGVPPFRLGQVHGATLFVEIDGRLKLEKKL